MKKRKFSTRRWAYWLGRLGCRFVGFCCFRTLLLHGQRMGRPGGYVLACSHLGHVEPFIVSALMDRPIEWMSRIEFYRYRPVARMLDAVGAFPVNRQGFNKTAIRSAIQRASGGRIVGIFPEGGVTTGPASVLRGGPIKKGACVIAGRAGVPVVPVAIVGTEPLTRVGPWLPFRHARIGVCIGEPVFPPTAPMRRKAARDLMAAELQAEFASLFAELRAADPTLLPVGE